MAIRFAFGVLRLFALGLTLSLPGTAQAQSVPPCRTTAGEDGLVFEGTYAMIFSPVDFDTASAAEAEVAIIPELRDGLGVLGLGKASAAGSVVVEFRAGDAAVHACTVQVVAFDREVHDVARLQGGDCNLRLIAGREELVAGHAQVLEFVLTPPPARDAFGHLRLRLDISVSNPFIADFSRLTDDRFYLLAKQPGVTTLAWVLQRGDGTSAISLCPITAIAPTEVFGENGPGDEMLCQNLEGQPIRLKVGQTTGMRFPDVPGVQVSEASNAAPSIVLFDFVEGGKSGKVEAVAPGTTSITLFGGEAEVVAHCEIVVE